MHIFLDVIHESSVFSSEVCGPVAAYAPALHARTNQKAQQIYPSLQGSFPEPCNQGTCQPQIVR